MERKLNQVIVDQFESLESKVNGSKDLPLHKIRREAFASLKEAGLPGNKSEEYKFTRLTTLLERNLDLSLVNTRPNLTQKTIEDHFIKSLEGSHMVFINDELSIEFSNIHPEHRDIDFKDLSEAALKSSSNLDQYFDKNKLFTKDAYLAWNTALAEKGTLIGVSKNKTYDKPIILYFFSDAQDQQVINRPRLMIDIGENAEVTFVEKSVTIGNNLSFNNAAMDIVTGKNSRGKYIRVQSDVENSIVVNNTQVYQPDSSTFTFYTFTFSGKMIRNNLNYVIDGEGCEGNMFGLYLTRGNTHVDNHTSMDHRQPNSVSNELYKGIMKDKSRGVFNGKIFVRQAAQKTNAFQANNNILLSDEATVNTKPQLEIWADDVKCSHGCTIGQLDDDQIFYLRSRGIKKDDATTILLHAFARDILDRIPLEGLKELLEQKITERLK